MVPGVPVSAVVVLLPVELRCTGMHRHHVRRQRRAGVHRDQVRRVRMLRVVVVVVDLRRLRVMHHVRRRGMRRRRLELRAHLHQLVIVMVAADQVLTPNDHLSTHGITLLDAQKRCTSGRASPTRPPWSVAARGIAPRAPAGAAKAAFEFVFELVGAVLCCVAAELVTRSIGVRRDRAGADVDPVLGVLAEAPEHGDARERDPHAEIDRQAEDFHLAFVAAPSAVDVAEAEGRSSNLGDFEPAADRLFRLLANATHRVLCPREGLFRLAQRHLKRHVRASFFRGPRRTALTPAVVSSAKTPRQFWSFAPVVTEKAYGCGWLVFAAPLWLPIAPRRRAIPWRDGDDRADRARSTRITA